MLGTKASSSCQGSSSFCLLSPVLQNHHHQNNNIRSFHRSIPIPQNNHTDPSQYVLFEEIPLQECIAMLERDDPKRAAEQKANKIEHLSSSQHRGEFSAKQTKTIGVVTINRPEKMNSLCPETAVQFKALFESEKIQGNRNLAAVVLMGAPPPPPIQMEDGSVKQVHAAFSAGGDYDFLLERTDDTPFNNAVRMSKFYDSFLSPMLRVCPSPVIACINGHAVGAGLGLACAADIRVMEASAKMSFNFVKIGLSPGMGASHILPYLVGHQVASYMLLTGDLITAEKAKEFGVVLEVLQGQKAVKHRAFEIAVQIAKSSHIASLLCLHSLRVQKLAGITACMYRESDAQVQSFADEELRQHLLEMKNKEEARLKSKEKPKPNN